MKEIELGDIVKCRVTGFEGMVVGRNDWLFGCTQWAVKKMKLKEGKPMDLIWFDTAGLVIVKASGIKPEIEMIITATEPGGPADRLPTGPVHK